MNEGIHFAEANPSMMQTKKIAMIRIFALLTLFAGFCASAAAKPVMLFLLGGRSNMDGCCRWENLTDEMRQATANVKIRDNTHFDSKGQITLGERMAEAMLIALAPNQSHRHP